MSYKEVLSKAIGEELQKQNIVVDGEQLRTIKNRATQLYIFNSQPFESSILEAIKVVVQK